MTEHRYLYFFLFSLFVTVPTALQGAPSYFAPTSLISFRMREQNGLFREFDRGSNGVGELVGAHGWRGTIDGDAVIIKAGKHSKDEAGEYKFIEGKPEEITDDDGLPKGEKLADLWPSRQNWHRNDEKFFDVWREVGRFRAGYKNPNKSGLLFAEIGLLMLSLAASRRKWLRVTAIAAATVMFTFTVMTGSRSSVIAYLSGAAILVGFQFRTMVIKNLKFAMTAALLIGVIIVCGSDRITKKMFSLDSHRAKIFCVAPRMMTDAPDGWGWYQGGYMTGSGKAYFDWYQPLKDFVMPLTLVSDHVTYLVGFSWLGRMAYILSWMLLFSVLLYLAITFKFALPLALWMAFVVVSSLNRIMDSWTLWCLPCIVTASSIPRLIKNFKFKNVLNVIASAVGVTMVMTGLLYYRGVSTKVKSVAVRAENGRIYFKSRKKPAVWIVDDGTVLGGGFVAKELRYYYRKHPCSPGIGYVRNVMDLPNDVHRLVLAGMSGWHFLMALNDGHFPAEFNMPAKIIFISPPFPPNAVPELMQKNVELEWYAGEFATSYYKNEYSEAPKWVHVVKGAELYIPNWIELITKL